MSSLDPRSIERIEISQLQPDKRNARVHSKRQIEQVAGSISEFGFNAPVLIDETNGIIAGHARVEAAKLLGHSYAPCLRLSHLTAAQKRAYMLADNRLPLSATWDFEILSEVFNELMEIGVDMGTMGFELEEIDRILTDVEEASTAGIDRADDHPQPLAQAVTRQGDCWVLGRHAMACGDAKDRKLLDTLMGGRSADMIFCDPPYNLKIDGHVSGLGRTQHREFAEASGEMSMEQFTEFLRLSFIVAAAVCKDGAIAFVCMDFRHQREILAAGYEVFSELKNLCVWNKTNGGMGSFYRSQHELIFVFKIGTAPHTNTFGLGDRGRYRTNVWTYPGVNTFKSDRMEELGSHPTVKPVAMVADAIRDVSHRGEVVLDTFGGSGTTLIAAQKTGRIARLIELDPIYCDVIIRRWQRLTGKRAYLAATNEPFETVQAARLAAQTVSTKDVAA